MIVFFLLCRTTRRSHVAITDLCFSKANKNCEEKDTSLFAFFIKAENKKAKSMQEKSKQSTQELRFADSSLDDSSFHSLRGQ
jgi:hypothetical protein